MIRDSNRHPKSQNWSANLCKFVQCSILSPIKIAQDMGVFRHLAAHETATANELAALTGAEEPFVGTYTEIRQ